MQAFEDLLEHLRAANCGEAPPRLPDDPARLAALHREALHFALPGRRSAPSSCLVGPSSALPRLSIIAARPGRAFVQLSLQSSGPNAWWSRAGPQPCAGAGIAERVGAALQECPASQEAAQVGSSQGPWQYDAVYAETGFHKQAHTYVQVALHAANLEIQVPFSGLYSVLPTSADARAPCRATWTFVCK